jgi:hypothetical protein
MVVLIILIVCGMITQYKIYTEDDDKDRVENSKIEELSTE